MPSVEWQLSDDIDHGYNSNDKSSSLHAYMTVWTWLGWLFACFEAPCTSFFFCRRCCFEEKFLTEEKCWYIFLIIIIVCMQVKKEEKKSTTTTENVFHCANVHMTYIYSECNKWVWRCFVTLATHCMHVLCITCTNNNMIFSIGDASTTTVSLFDVNHVRVYIWIHIWRNCVTKWAYKSYLKRWQ